MHRDESRTDLGAIKIYRSAVASVVALAATEIEGVQSIGRNFFSNFLELSGKKNSEIRVEFLPNSEVFIKVPLTIRYGYNISAVAAKVQENVRKAVEETTNLIVRDIFISIKSVEKGAGEVGS
jgi:uncharacterized alkaline shock family protein YloU